MTSAVQYKSPPTTTTTTTAAAAAAGGAVGGGVVVLVLRMVFAGVPGCAVCGDVLLGCRRVTFAVTGAAGGGVDVVVVGDSGSGGRVDRCAGPLDTVTADRCVAAVTGVLEGHGFVMIVPPVTVRVPGRGGAPLPGWAVDHVIGAVDGVFLAGGAR